MIAGVASPYFGRRRNSIFIHPAARGPWHPLTCRAFTSTSDIFQKHRAPTAKIIKTSQQYQQSSFSIRHLSARRGSQQNIYIIRVTSHTKTTTTPGLPRPASMLLRGTPASLCGRYAAEPPPRRSCCSAAPRITFKLRALPSPLRGYAHETQP